MFYNYYYKTTSITPIISAMAKYTMAMNALIINFLVVLQLQRDENSRVSVQEDDPRGPFGRMLSLWSLSVNAITSSRHQHFQHILVTYTGRTVEERPASIGVVWRPNRNILPAIDRLDDRGNVFSQIHFDWHI